MSSPITSLPEESLHPIVLPLTTDQLNNLILEAVRQAISEERSDLCTPLSETEASKFLGLKPQTLAVWRTKGTGPAYYKIGSNVRYSRTDLEVYIKQQRVPR